MNPPDNASYIGDGVYAWHDGYQVWIATQRIQGHWCSVAIEPRTMENLINFAAAANKRREP